MIGLAAITLTLQLQRSSFDLLDGVDVEVAVHNTAKTPVSMTFPKPAEYEIDVLRGQDVIWSNITDPPPGVTFPVHAKQFLPGPTIMVVYIWNGVASDGTTPGPGEYTVRARLLGTNATQTASATLHFIDPVPISALEKIKLGDVVTVAGHLDPTKMTLTDASGSVALMKRFGTIAPDATVAVRGYLTVLPNHTHAFFVQRWAVMR
ncbi:MAG TPA: hypothetical protein VNF68_04900 [Candidatus Baltobacteraceae bacterium]|nr:hypothetical protein [Candidatus Baltobacteraceae bacterium]